MLPPDRQPFPLDERSIFLLSLSLSLFLGSGAHAPESGPAIKLILQRNKCIFVIFVNFVTYCTEYCTKQKIFENYALYLFLICLLRVRFNKLIYFLSNWANAYCISQKLKDRHFIEYSRILKSSPPEALGQLQSNMT